MMVHRHATLFTDPDGSKVDVETSIEDDGTMTVRLVLDGFRLVKLPDNSYVFVKGEE